MPALKDVMLNLVTTNPFDSLAEGDVLPSSSSRSSSAFALRMIKDKVPMVRRSLEQRGRNDVQADGIVMWFAPFGVFSLIAATIAKQARRCCCPAVT